MINIAICDDNIFVCTELEDIILKYGEKNYLDFNIEIFYRGESLYEHLTRNKKYDIIFLDIEMYTLNGVHIGKRLRNDIKDELTKIVYISAYKDYAMELFEIRPFNFIIKPIDENKLIDTLEKIINNMNIDNKGFIYKVGHSYKKEDINNIIYFESQEKKVKMVTLNYTEIFYGSLKEVYKQLLEYKFFYPHKSYLVNYNHIKFFEYNQLILVNDIIIPIGKTRKKLVRDLQLNFERS